MKKRAVYEKGKMVDYRNLKEVLQHSTEIVPQIRKLLEETAFLVFQLASWAALIMLVFGKL